LLFHFYSTVTEIKFVLVTSLPEANTFDEAS
jgi:hypothetical protein